MPLYESYTDTNGVRWTIITAARSIFATQPDDSPGPRYDPPPPDLGPVTRVDLPDSATDAEVAERDRATFVKLREKIDEYATANKQRVALRVTASREGLGWLFVAGLALYIFGRKGRRG